jgi:large subunit ribosomal protein L29
VKTEEIRTLSPQELDDRVAELEEELFRLRIQNETGQLDNPLRIRGARRDLARCKTIRNEAARRGV